ncbi:GNAT family N-acetyltransferase [Streptomyces sp. NPDC006464]|uniref:GNAT family N-acetyltransferase n=1 Tax=unclassified Streptomyces TaxID=2593676 RepID=UPI0033B44F8A
MRDLLTVPLHSERLDLVPLRIDHAAEMAAVLADPALYAFTGGAPATVDELRARYERMLAGAPDPGVDWCNWVLRLRADGALAGTVQATLAPAGEAAPPTGREHTVPPGSPTPRPASHDSPAPGAAPSGPARAAGRVAEIAWVVGTERQGRGLASEAARALVAWLGTQDVSTVVAHVHPDHHASAAVAAAAGLSPTAGRQDGEIRWELDLPRA